MKGFIVDFVFFVDTRLLDRGDVGVAAGFVCFRLASNIEDVDLLISISSGRPTYRALI